MTPRILVVLLVSSLNGFASDLALELRPLSGHYKVGQTISLEIIFTNTSERSIGIIPWNVIYEAQVLDLKRVDNGKKARRVPFMSGSFDPEAMSRNFRLLQGHQSYRFKLNGKLASKLPSITSSLAQMPAGLYLVFGGSAMKLPGPGQYRMTSSYSVLEEERKFLRGKNASHLWIGETRTKPVTITVE